MVVPRWMETLSGARASMCAHGGAASANGDELDEDEDRGRERERERRVDELAREGEKEMCTCAMRIERIIYEEKRRGGRVRLKGSLHTGCSGEREADKVGGREME